MVGFDYKLIHIKGISNHLADYLSRNPAENADHLNTAPSLNQMKSSINYIMDFAARFVTISELQDETNKDEHLCRLKVFLQDGWSKKLNKYSTLQKY